MQSQQNLPSLGKIIRFRLYNFFSFVSFFHFERIWFTFGRNFLRKIWKPEVMTLKENQHLKSLTATTTISIINIGPLECNQTLVNQEIPGSIGSFKTLYVFGGRFKCSFFLQRQWIFWLGLNIYLISATENIELYRSNKTATEVFLTSTEGKYSITFGHI